MISRLFKKTFIGWITVLIAIGFLFVPAHRADAFLGIGDITFDPTSWAESILQFAQTTAKWIKDEVFATLRDAAVKRIIDDMTDQIIYSIENGGSPLFVQDFNAYLNRAGDLAFDEVNNFLIRDAGVSLCAPFRPQLTLYFYNNIAGGAGAQKRNFGFPPVCRFQDFQQNIQNTQTFIQSGGWVGLQQLFLPENNLLGATIALESSYYSRAASIMQEREATYQANKGYLSVESCALYESPINGELVGPDQFQAEAKQACTDVGREDDLDACVEEFKDFSCRKKETKTPGDVIAQSATKGVLKDFEYAQNVNSIISALVNVFIKNVFDETKGLIFASTARGNNLAANTISTGDVVRDNTLTDRKRETLRTLNDINVNYIRAKDLLQKQLIPRVQQGRKLALEAIHYCYTHIGFYNEPPYGFLRYSPGGSNEIFYTATLSSLINMPLSTSTPPVEFALEGEPTLYELMEQAGYLVGSSKSFPPPFATTTPFQEGYFERTLRNLKAASQDVDTLLITLDGLRSELNAVSTATTTIRTELVDGVPTEIEIDNVASSVLVLSNILNKANNQYHDFVQRYKAYIGDTIGGEQSGTGPGALKGSTDMSGLYESIIDGLKHPDYGITSTTKGANFFYCEFKK